MECDPTASVDLVIDTFPWLSACVPKAEPPSLSVTDPVGVPVVNDFTIAVKVTPFPCLDGFRDEVTPADVAAFVTVCVTAGETLPLKFASPPYTAVSECEPTASVDILKVAFPPLSVAVPRFVVPSLKLTGPVGVAGPPVLTVAVNVTACLSPDGFGDETSEVVVAAFSVVADTALESDPSPPTPIADTT